MKNYKIQTISNSIFATNSYVLSDKDTRKGLLIDPSFDPKRIESYIKEEQLEIEGILVTHGHQDHIFSVEYFKNLFSCSVYASFKTQQLFSDPIENLSYIGAEHFNLTETQLTIDVQTVEDNGTYHIGDFEFTTAIYPGHSRGCTIFEFSDFIFTGDFLFKGTIGRVDWPGSSKEEMRESLERFKERYQTLDKVIYPGHNEVSTLQHEFKQNMFLLNPQNVFMLP